MKVMQNVRYTATHNILINRWLSELGMGRYEFHVTIILAKIIGIHN